MLAATVRTGSHLVTAALAGVLCATPALAQFASDFPGVPRASISLSSGQQNRTAWTLSGYKIPGASGGPGDTVAGGLRLAIGRSYRIRSNFEAGFDFTLVDGLGIFPPKGSSTTTTRVNGSTYYQALVAYAFRIGGKWRPISALDQDGNGYELAIGGAFQPELKPLYGYEMVGDSSRSGGQFQTTKASTAFRRNPFAKISASTAVAGMASYRSRRLRGDAAIVGEAVPDRVATADPSPITAYTGVSLRLGGVFRVNPSFAVGGSYWGNGSPPWSDEVRLNVPGKRAKEQWGFLLQWGDPESGIDIMPSFPTGKISEAARLYIRFRSAQ